MRNDARAAQLAYYMRELESFRDESAIFARRYPKVAGALDLGREGSEDPHVERMIEAFAFMAGRLRRNMDQQLPRLAAGLLDTLYPHLTAPTPSMGVAAFKMDPDKAAKAQNGFRIPRGAELQSAGQSGVTCRFRTAWETTLWPIEPIFTDAPKASSFASLKRIGGDVSTIRVRLRALGGLRFSDMRPTTLRFKIGGQKPIAMPVHEALTTRLHSIWAGDPCADDAPEDRGATVEASFRRLPAAALTQVGFAQDEALLPQPPSAHHGHRLIREYFAMPEKFLFFDVAGLAEAAGDAGTCLDLVFVLDGPPPRVDSGSLTLGATPVINLFSRTSEPIRIDRTRTEYHLSPDYRRERSTEIHSIESVTLRTSDAPDGAPVGPFFSFSHQDAQEPRVAWWTFRRRPTTRPDLTGADVMISFRDRDFTPTLPSSDVAFARVLCTNRGLAERPPANTGLGCEFESPSSEISWETRPTPQIDAPEIGDDLWRLVSHLSVNQLSFGEGENALPALREHLRLYAALDARDAGKQIAAITGISSRRVARRVGVEGWRGFCRGAALTLTLDEDMFPDGSGVLFGAVLSRFFGLYAGAGSFNQLSLLREKGGGEWATWPPIAGEQILV